LQTGDRLRLPSKDFPMSPISRHVLAAVVAALLLSPVPVVADEADELARRLIALRGEVEQLNATLEQAREEQRATLLGLNQQRAQMEADLKRQELAAQEARDRLAQAAEASAGAGVAGDALKPVLASVLDQLVAGVKGGLPFKVEERVAALEAIRLEIDSGRLAPHRAANRVWAFVEDEFRLARETGLHQQTLSIDGKPMLAEVAKVGNVMLFWRTQDRRYGEARRAGQEWEFVEITEQPALGQVEALFGSLDKQIRQGYFELPGALVPAGAR
jgi:hypothetical protein